MMTDQDTRVGVAFAAIVLAMLPAVLDQTILATALPVIAGDLGSLSDVSWVVSAYVVGDEGLRTALAAAGLTLLEGSASDAETVVVGWDRGFDYAELATACVLVQRGASLVASNADASYPVVAKATCKTLPAWPRSRYAGRIGPLVAMALLNPAPSTAYTEK